MYESELLDPSTYSQNYFKKITNDVYEKLVFISISFKCSKSVAV